MGECVGWLELCRQTFGNVDDLNRPAGFVCDAGHLNPDNAAWSDRVEG